jgi:hypothetical protein
MVAVEVLMYTSYGAEREEHDDSKVRYAGPRVEDGFQTNILAKSIAELSTHRFNS